MLRLACLSREFIIDYSIQSSRELALASRRSNWSEWCQREEGVNGAGSVWFSFRIGIWVTFKRVIKCCSEACGATGNDFLSALGLKPAGATAAWAVNRADACCLPIAGIVTRSSCEKQWIEDRALAIKAGV